MINNPLGSQAKDMNRQFTEKKVQKASKHEKLFKYTSSQRNTN